MSLLPSRAGTRRLALAGLCSLQLLAAGCATVPGGDPRDPWESYNRRMLSFNEALDARVVEPLAKGYQTVFPDVVRTGVSNFFGNLSDVWTAFNQLLQLKPREFGQSVARVGINTTVGLLGVVDVASNLDIPRRREDFGQTLGHWGLGTGPYVMLPLFGPSTLRDSVVLPIDWRGDLVNSTEGSVRAPLTVVRIVDRRASLLGATQVMEGAVLDKYSFIRDAYLQRRRGAAPTPDSQTEERYDLPEAPAAAPGAAAAPPPEAPAAAEPAKP